MTEDQKIALARALLVHQTQKKKKNLLWSYDLK